MGKKEKQEPPKTEEKKVPKPSPSPSPSPSPCVLSVDFHCMGCAKKIQKYIMKMRGVEGVVIDMVKNEVTIKGTVEPQAICNMITEKTKRKANVISPLPQAQGKLVISQVSEPVTVELHVNMHCVACAKQLKGKILKMRGVQTVVTEFGTGKVIVTGTVDANKLVDYLYKRTKKQAKIVSQPKPEPKPEKKEETKKAEKPAEKEEEAKPEEKTKKKQVTKKAEKLVEEEAKPEQKKEENTKKKEVTKEAEKPKKEENTKKKEETKEAEKPKKEENNNGGNQDGQVVNVDEELMKRIMYYYAPLYGIEQIPHPQLFSDENPNACCIS